MIITAPLHMMERDENAYFEIKNNNKIKDHSHFYKDK